MSLFNTSKAPEAFEFVCEGTVIFKSQAIRDATLIGYGKIALRIPGSDSRKLAEALLPFQTKEVSILVGGKMLTTEPMIGVTNDAIQIKPASIVDAAMLLRDNGIKLHGLVDSN